MPDARVQIASDVSLRAARRVPSALLANAKSSVSAEMALRLEKAFGVSMDLLLRMQAGYDAAQARLRGSEINVRRYHPSGARS